MIPATKVGGYGRTDKNREAEAHNRLYVYDFRRFWVQILLDPEIFFFYFLQLNFSIACLQEIVVLLTFSLYTSISFVSPLLIIALCGWWSVQHEVYIELYISIFDVC